MILSSGLFASVCSDSKILIIASENTVRTSINLPDLHHKLNSTHITIESSAEESHLSSDGCWWKSC